MIVTARKPGNLGYAFGDSENECKAISILVISSSVNLILLIFEGKRACICDPAEIMASKIKFKSHGLTDVCSRLLLFLDSLVGGITNKMLQFLLESILLVI